MDQNIKFDKKKKNLLDDIDYLDVLVNTLNDEVNIVSNQLDELERITNKHIF
jgi:hypothetical protein